MAFLVSALFFARVNFARRLLRMAGTTSSTIRIVPSSRNVASCVWPVFVLVVMPRITLTLPPQHSSAVTPPVTSASICVSSYTALTPVTP